MLIYGADG